VSIIVSYSFSVFVGGSDCFGMRLGFIKWAMVYLIKKPGLIGFNNFSIDKFKLIDRISLYISLGLSTSLMLRVIQLFSLIVNQ
jgi:hypothetical protein